MGLRCSIPMQLYAVRTHVRRRSLGTEHIGTQRRLFQSTRARKVRCSQQLVYGMGGQGKASRQAQ